MADNKATITRVYEVISDGDIDGMDELVAAEVVEHEELPEGLPQGREGVKAWFAAMRVAFPDLTTTVDAMVAEGDEVWAMVVFRGTHRGEFMGVPATDRTFEMNVIDRFRLADGRVVEHWGVADQMAMMAQLGLVDGPDT